MIKRLSDDRPVLECESLEPRMMLSSVQILAAGVTGEEIINVAVDGAVVQTYNNLGTGAAARNFVSLNFSTPNPITADQVRISFTNDLYDPANNIDRNARIDAIVIDGLRFESEAPTVFSTGTWKAADGIVPGFRLSEYLHANGYFQYAGGGGPVDPGVVVINEIHYNPGPDGVVDPDAEFLELYNPGTTAVNLSGMSFTGFDLTFAAGTTLGAGQYAIVAPSIAIAQAQWGVTPIAQFAAGGLSGGGETIQLLAADGVTVVDEVTYDDAAPWVTAPDGNGPSLELLDWTFDNSLAASWAASIGNPTPAAVNSVVGGVVPGQVENITITPGQPLPNQAFAISATIPDATFANLTYKVMFGADQTIAMTNVGGDVWTATVPGQAAGALVRYKIASDVAIAPFAGDTINYLGVVVADTDIVGNTLPVFQFFAEPAAFDNLINNLALTNEKIPVVVAYGGKVVDNATVRVRGGDFSRLNYPKKSLKFELPSGQSIDIGAEGSYPIDEFAVNADFGDWSVVNPDISWDVFNNETESFTSSFFMRVERNGNFHGVFRFQELYDGAFRNANGFGDDEFYKADGGGFGSTAKFDKKKPDDGDYTSINILNDVLTAPPSSAKTSWLLENVDVANVVNHAAISAMMRHDDQKVQNFYVALDGDTGLWRIVEWDVDRTWVDPNDGSGPFTTPEPIDNELLNSIFEIPEFQAMYWRRMQTLVDTYLADDRLIERRAELINQIGPTNSTLEFNLWGRTDIYPSTYFADEFRTAIEARRAIFAAETRMPGSASGIENIVINELHYSPAGTSAEFLELYNNSNESIDVSGWTIDGVGLTIGFGTVILPNEYLVFTDNMTQFRIQNTNDIFIGGQYSGGLKSAGETITLFDVDGNVVDQVAYTNTAPWPTTATGTGYTIALTDFNLDNNLASSWVASTVINGTPGKSNNFVPTPANTIKIFAAGQTTNEIIQLQVNGQVVATFNLGASGSQLGDYTARRFTELTWTSAVPIVATDVRVNFVNDVYDPANGIDRNVKIDRIEIGTRSYQTEASTVFSTGTWLPADGIQPGFRRSEILHANGYFQYQV